MENKSYRFYNAMQKVVEVLVTVGIGAAVIAAWLTGKGRRVVPVPVPARRTGQPIRR
jgi:hypothetical protein